MADTKAGSAEDAEAEKPSKASAADVNDANDEVQGIQLQFKTIGRLCLDPYVTACVMQMNTAPDAACAHPAGR